MKLIKSFVPHSRCFGSYFDVIFLMYLVSSGFSFKPTSSSSSSSSTQFSQEWARRKVVVKHSIKSKNQTLKSPRWTGVWCHQYWSINLPWWSLHTNMPGTLWWTDCYPMYMQLLAVWWCWNGVPVYCISFLGGLRVTNPTIRLMISVCPSVRLSVRPSVHPSVTFWLFDGPHFDISTKTTALTSQCVMSMN